VRHYELPELVRVAAPAYLKFTVRNAPHLPERRAPGAARGDSARERVRRAAIGLAMLKRYNPEAIGS
jgi:hypothetical protein